MFAYLSDVLHNATSYVRDHRRDDYLAASSDLADLEHRMRRLETDNFDCWPQAATDASDYADRQRSHY
jgi:hypothetical protein